MEPSVSHKNQFCILIADDDDDDVFFTTSAFKEIGNTIPVRSVHNGEELLNYLLKKGAFRNEEVILPVFILLDLNMPKKDGKTTLAEIRKNPLLSNIPVIIFSTSNSEKDRADTARLGCTAYITKTPCYNELKKIAQALKSHWIDPLLNASGSSTSPARHHA